ncbi:MAG TPA: ATP-binding protein [Bacteroidales bacterium]|nr:ATP-binding protein [Bacteroidales bacterium]
MNPGKPNLNWKEINALLEKLRADYPENDTVRSLDRELHFQPPGIKITHSKTEDVLKEIEPSIARIIRLAEPALLELDEDYTILGANSRSAEITGTNIRDLYRKKFTDFILPEYTEFFISKAGLLLKTGLTQPMRIDIRDAKGKIHNVFLYGSVTEDGNHYRHIRFQFIDFDELLPHLFPHLVRKSTIFGISFPKNRSLVYELDREGRVTAINKTFEEVLGYKPSEVIGRKYTEFVSSEEHHDLLKEYDNVRRNKNLSVKNYHLMHKSGNRISLNCTSYTTTRENGKKSLVIISDETMKAMDSEEELKRIKLLQDIIFSHLQGMDVYMIDTDMRFLYAAGKEKNKFSLTDDDFMGKTIHEILPPRTQKTLIPLYRDTLKGNSAKREIHFSGQVFELTTSPVKNQNGEVMAAVIISKNITREKANHNQLRKAKQEAEAADKAKSMFLASMSHEIRTPLNTIIGFSSQLKKTELSDEQKKYIKIIRDSSDQLINVVNELLIIFKIGMGRVFIDKAPFSIRDMFDDICEIFEPEAGKKGLDFSCKVSRKVPRYVVGDLFRMKQVLINIVGNAIKYTDSGTVKLTARVLENKKRKIYLNFDISDTGIGIPEDELPYIFDEFRQAQNLESKKRNGTGLGLTITRKLVELQKGRISVKSTLNKGTTIVATLPFQKTREKDIPRKTNLYDIRHRLLQGKRILLVDDDEQNLVLADMLFKEWGMKYDITADSEDGIELTRINKYDIIMLDIHMPKINGIELMKMIREDSRNPNSDCNIITITANILQKDLKKYLSSGFDDYILKPFREEELYSKICRVLEIDIPDTDHQSTDTPAMEISSPKDEDEYDLSDLLATAKGDKDFINRTVLSFTDNARMGLNTMKTGRGEKNWDDTGEAAHKLITAFRYFKCHQIVENLIAIENMALHTREYDHLPQKVNETIPLIEKTLQKITQQFNLHTI